jgi:hypothetical protein
MSDATRCDAVCRCVAKGVCSTISGLKLRQAQYDTAVDFLAKRALRGQTVDSRTSPRDLLPRDFDYSGLKVNAADRLTGDSHDVDPLAAAAKTANDRYKAPRRALDPKTHDELGQPWDWYEQMKRRVGS